ncbi:MAG: glucosaminidase domain-containing protein [Bacteroidota bacterium]
MKTTRGIFLLAVLLGIALRGTAQTMSVEDYIAKYKPLAIAEMYAGHIPASITLAQGILESGNGNSVLTKNTNNHFGIKCKPEWTGGRYYYDDDAKGECFRVYPTDTASYKDHTVFLTTRDRYAFLFKLDITDYKAWAKGLKDAGYATKSDYAELIIGIIERNNLAQLDLAGQYPRDTSSNVNNVPKIKHKGDIASGKHKNTEDFKEVPIQKGARIISENNGVKLVKAKRNDNFVRIASDIDLLPADVARFNDVNPNYKLTEGERIYIERKKNQGNIGAHIVKKNETMFQISQEYAVRLRSLYRLNHMKYGTQAKEGQKLLLQKTAQH